ncbi:MAG: type II toxin-antitoxin system RelE/ParE family toxin [Methylococcales bacterium]
MSLSVSFVRAARGEFEEASARYEAQRPSLGMEFIAEIERCVALVADQPEMYAVIHKDVRRVTVRRFPYSVHFRAESDRIVVLCVFHGSRDPALWQRRA